MEKDPVVRSTREAHAADPLCPAPEALAAWIDQGLGAAERVRLEAHLAGCAECRLLVAQVIEIQVEAGAEAPAATELMAHVVGGWRFILSALGWGVAALAMAAVRRWRSTSLARGGAGLLPRLSTRDSRILPRQ